MKEGGLLKKDTTADEVLKIGEKCNKCGKCCMHGSGFVLDSEVSKIAAFLNMPKEKFAKEFIEESEIFHTTVFKFKSLKEEGKPYGPCSFQKKSLCSIQEVKPLHCRIGNCGEHGDDLHVWFMLNYLLNVHDPESVRQYDSYIKTGGKILPGAELSRLFKDKVVLDSILSYDRIR